MKASVGAMTVHLAFHLETTVKTWSSEIFCWEISSGYFSWVIGLGFFFFLAGLLTYFKHWRFIGVWNVFGLLFCFVFHTSVKCFCPAWLCTDVLEEQLCAAPCQQEPAVRKLTEKFVFQSRKTPRKLVLIHLHIKMSQPCISEYFLGLKICKNTLNLSCQFYTDATLNIKLGHSLNFLLGVYQKCHAGISRNQQSWDQNSHRRIWNH